MASNMVQEKETNYTEIFRGKMQKNASIMQKTHYASDGAMRTDNDDAKNTLWINAEISTVNKIDNAFPMYRTSMKGKALQSELLNRILTYKRSFLPTLTLCLICF